MNYWILKSEPSTYSIDDLKKDKKTRWDGVRNYQARKNLRSMAKGDLAYIYHSGDDKAIVGLAKIESTAYQDPTTKEDWSVVDISFVKEFETPLTLASLKAHKILSQIALVKQSRLSVSPLSKDHFELIKEQVD